jgi:hypothetical protein
VSEPRDRRWLAVAAAVAIVYPVVGVAFAALSATSVAMRLPGRWAAWLACAAAFAIHLAYEHFKLRSTPLRAALHVSLAIAAGALLLALWVTSHSFAPQALVLFPLITAVPAFVAAFIVSSLLARARRGPSS